MNPPVFALLNVPAVTDLLALQPDGSVAIYPHGEAPEGVVAPYVVWYALQGIPERVLTGPTPYDDVRIRVECYVPTGAGAIGDELQRAVVETIEADHYVEFYADEGRDPEIDVLRRIIDFQWLSDR